MKQVIYAMQFKGTAGPKAGASGVIKASTTAPSCTLSSVVDPGGVSGTLLPVPGGKASFESEVTLTGETSFTETGTIRFGDSNHLLRFSTVGQGFLGIGNVARRERRRSICRREWTCHLELHAERHRRGDR